MRKQPLSSFDVCIVGGGPAGSILGLRLAHLGRRVAIVEKAVFPRRHVGESLTGGLMPLLETVGLRGEIESAGFLSSEWATVKWAGEFKRYRVHGGSGLQVDRARFDEILLRATSRADSVNVYQPSRIVDRSYVDGQWRIKLDTGEVLTAQYLADAAGRGRVLEGTKLPIGAATLAIYAYWVDVMDGDADTLVEAGPSAWYWGAPLPGGEFNATVFVDPKRRDGAHEYLGMLRRSSLIWPRLSNASISGRVRTCDATPFADQSPVTRSYIKVGDAALSIDPLSSQGVQTAIGTALHGAVVLNTLIDKPEDTDLAIGFYRERLASSASFHSAAASRFYEEQHTVCGGDFWRNRVRDPEREPSVTRLSPSSAPDSPLRVAPSIQFTTVAVVNASHVVREDGIKLNSRPIAYIGDGIPVAPVLRDIDRPMAAAEILRRWSRKMPSETALLLLRWAREEGILESAGNSPA